MTPSTSVRIASRVSRDSISTCRCAPSRRARRKRRPRRSIASAIPRSGDCGRRRGVSAEIFTERFTRGSVPIESFSSAGLGGKRAALLGEHLEGLFAASFVGVGLALGDRRFAEEIDRGRNARQPERLDRTGGVRRALADDETSGQMANRRARECGDDWASEAVSTRLLAESEEHRQVWKIREIGDEMPDDLFGGVAGWHHVDEAEKRRPERGIVSDELVHSSIEHLERASRRPRQCLGDGFADLVDLPIDGIERFRSRRSTMHDLPADWERGGLPRRHISKDERVDNVPAQSNPRAGLATAQLGRSPRTGTHHTPIRQDAYELRSLDRLRQDDR